MMMKMMMTKPSNVLLLIIFHLIIHNLFLLTPVKSAHNTHNNAHSPKSYKSRRFLNETILGKTKVTVDSFIDAHKVTALLKFVKKILRRKTQNLLT
jgi:hypothetical protein